jgi:hypothetical protein
MVIGVVPVALAQFQDDTLRLTCKIRGRSSTKMKCAKLPELVVFILPYRWSVNHMYAKAMPFR